MRTLYKLLLDVLVCLFLDNCKRLILHDQTSPNKNNLLNNPDIDPDLNLPNEFDDHNSRYIKEDELHEFLLNLAKNLL